MLCLSMCLGVQCNSHSEAERAAWQQNRIPRTVCNRHPWKNGNTPHTAWVGKYSTAGKRSEFNKWKLLLHLDSTVCQLSSVSAWQSSPAPSTCHVFSSFLTFTPAFDGFSWSHHWFPWLLLGVLLWLERWMPFPNLLPQTVDQSWASLRQTLLIAYISYSC